MKNWLLAASMILGAAAASAQGYKINLTLKPFTSGTAYLAYHYGEGKGIADSARIDASGKAVFQGSKPLPGGLYMVVSPQRVIMCELLLDKQQNFSISIDTNNLRNVVFTGSPENEAFDSYRKYSDEIGQKIVAFQEALKTAPPDQQETLRNQIASLNKELDTYRKNFMTKNPSSILTAFFKTIREPEIPPAEQHPGGKYDTLYAFNYYKSHFWDGVSFADGRLVRTPFFKPKLQRYFQQCVFPDPDSIIVEADKMLAAAEPSKDMFNFLLGHFIDKYINPEYMGQDKVFVHLFEKYINAGKADWLNEKQRKYVNERAYSLMANQLGNPAAVLNLMDTSGVRRSLYDIKAPFTVVVFWDATCGHCKEVVPKVDSLFRAKWKNEGIAVYGVMVDGGLPAWKKFIAENNLTGWIHVYQPDEDRDADYAAGRPNFRQLYDVYQTPVLYLLDENKRIIAKKLSYDQLDKVIELKKNKS